MTIYTDMNKLVIVRNKRGKQMTNNLWEAETWRDMSGNFVGYRVLKRDNKGQVADINSGFVVDIYDPKRKSHLMYEKAQNRANKLNIQSKFKQQA